MKKKIYLHIGLHKTGTTSIQVFCTRNALILENNGVLYPKTGRPLKYRFGQHQLPWTIFFKEQYVPDLEWKRNLKDSDINSIWESLHNEINNSSARVVVISSEEFDIFNAEEIAEVGCRLSSYDITPVLFLRNHADFIESSYRTAVMHSGYSNSIEHLSENSRSRLDYFDMIQDWRKIAFNNKVIILNYDNPCIRKNAIVAFLAACIPSASNFVDIAIREPRFNESFPAHIVEVVRYFRTKGVAEDIIQKWASQAVKLQNSESNKHATCMSYNLRLAMLEKFNSEMLLFLDDPYLADIGRECIDLINRKFSDEISLRVVASEVDALLYMFE